MKKDRLWVHPKFKKALKVEAATNGMSILEYTEKMIIDGEQHYEKQFIKKPQRFSGFKL